MMASLREQNVIESDGENASQVQNQNILQSAAIIKGIHTDFVITVYDDKIFILVTQLQKIGTLISVESERSALGGSNGYSTSVLLGRRDDPLLLIYARQVMEQVCAGVGKPLLLGIALKPEGRDPQTFESIMNELIRLKKW
mmetsp:Transcript_18747/g.24755  ORF Transcript_18747/g.24755 Transcript_18747/m.24755 type:complete len:141 (+) Transcript_18747:77-499(+)